MITHSCLKHVCHRFTTIGLEHFFQHTKLLGNLVVVIILRELHYYQLEACVVTATHVPAEWKLHSLLSKRAEHLNPMAM